MILFDLDGTLVDSVPDLSYSIDAMMLSIGRPPPGEVKVRRWIGHGIRGLVKSALTDDLQTDPDTALFEKAFEIFSNIYLENACERSYLYDGVEDCFNSLQQGDYKLGCITNKGERFTHIVLEKMGIDLHFGIVICGDSLPKCKPDPLPLLHAADHFGVSPINGLMVGDSVNDIDAAQAAGLQSLAVSYGYNHGKDIREARPDAVIDNLSLLPEMIMSEET